MNDQLIRLNKYLASQGITSRRRADDLISRNKVSINGRPAKLGDKINPKLDTIRFGKKIIPPQSQSATHAFTYVMLNKPAGYLSTTSDDHSRPTVLNLVKTKERLYPVGRLDYQSTGLILLTNDGDLTQKITHPKFHLPKVYLATFLGKVPGQKISQLQEGVVLDDGKTAPAKVQHHSSQFNQTTLQITLYQGKKRQIRRMTSALHLYLTDLHRISIGPLKLGDLPSGESRYLTQKEIDQLKQA